MSKRLSNPNRQGGRNRAKNGFGPEIELDNGKSSGNIRNGSFRVNENSRKNFVEELPILDFQGSRNPELWDEAKRRFEIYVCNSYGYECSILFKYDEIYVWEELPEPDPDDFSKANDPIGLKKIARIEDEKIRRKKLIEFNDNNRKIYTLIKGQCTYSLWNKVKLDKDFDIFDGEQLVEALWYRIGQILLGSGDDKEYDILTKQNFRFKFEKLRQFEKESVADFHQRFVSNLEALKVLEIDIGGDDDIAMYFIRKLDRRRFATLLCSLENDLLKKVNNYPKKLTEALSMATKWKVVSPKIDTNGNPVSTVFYTADQKISKSVSRFKKQEENYNDQNFANNKKQNNRKQNKIIKNKQNDECYYCKKKGHWKNNCPELIKDKSNVNKDNKSKNENDEEAYCVFSTENILKINEVNENKNFKFPNSQNILLDNQATISIFNNKELLTNIHDIATPIKINGIGGNQLLVKKKRNL